MPGGRTESEVRLMDAEQVLAAWGRCFAKPYEFVYVIRAKGDHPIKVGKAVDVHRRMAELQTGNPRQLELLAVMPGGYDLEWQLHFRMKSFRLVGEWFGGDAVPGFVEFAQRLMLWMLDRQHETGKCPDFTDFEDGWVFRRSRRDSSPAVVRFVEPDPEHVAKMAERRRQEADVQERVANQLPPPFARAPGDWIAREYGH